jgi:hypothetical protein
MQYATRFLDPAQIDSVDTASLLHKAGLSG